MRDARATNTLEPLQILIVDDDPQVLDVLQRTLSNIHSCTVANGQTEFEQRLEDADVVDLVIMDHDMPGTTPGTLLALVRAKAPETTVVGHSGRCREEEFARLGVSLFLQKPWGASDFHALLSGQGGP